MHTYSVKDTTSNITLGMAAPLVLWVAYQICYDMIYQSFYNSKDFELILKLKSQKKNNSSNHTNHNETMIKKQITKSKMSMSSSDKQNSNNDSNNDCNDKDVLESDVKNSKKKKNHLKFQTWILKNRNTWGNPSYNQRVLITYISIHTLFQLVVYFLQCQGYVFNKYTAMQQKIHTHT